MDNFSDKSEISSTRVMVMAALWAAIVFCMTMFPKVPIPLGYMNLGTTTIFLSIFFLRRHEACLAGAVGSCLADLIGGFPIWIIPTAVVKFAVAYEDCLQRGSFLDFFGFGIYSRIGSFRYRLHFFRSFSFRRV